MVMLPTTDIQKEKEHFIPKHFFSFKRYNPPPGYWIKNILSLKINENLNQLKQKNIIKLFCLTATDKNPK